MVQAGDQIQKDHRHPEDRHAHQVQTAPDGAGMADEDDGPHNAQQRPQAVGDGVEHFFPDAQAAVLAAVWHRCSHGWFLLY